MFSMEPISASPGLTTSSMKPRTRSRISSSSGVRVKSMAMSASWAMDRTFDVESECLGGQGSGQQAGRQVDQVADEQPVVGVGGGPGPAGQLGGREPHGREPAVET